MPTTNTGACVALWERRMVAQRCGLPGLEIKLIEPAFTGLDQ